MCKCEGSDAPDQSPKWKLEEHSKSVASRCLRCRKSVALTTVDEDLLEGHRLGLQSIAGALKLSTSKLHMSPDDASLVLGIDNRAIRAPCESFSSWCKVQTLSLMKWLFGPLDALEASFGCGTLRWHAEVRVWCGSNACHTWSRGRRSDFFARDAIGFAHSFKPTRYLQ